MPHALAIGSVRADRAGLHYGQWKAFSHPTGMVETIPVVVARGEEDGPCLWLVAGVHGNEHAGPAVIYRLLTDALVSRLKGSIVALPAFSPSALRALRYTADFNPRNPNRLWPEARSATPPDGDEPEAAAFESALRPLFACLTETASYLIDYHNAWIGSLPFAVRDRLLYDPSASAASQSAPLEALADQQRQMLEAFGFSVVGDFPARRFAGEGLHRSLSAAALLTAGIPAFTVELGTGEVPDAAIVAAAVAGTRNVLRWAGMLDGDQESIDIPVLDPGFPLRRSRVCRAPEACTVLHLVEPGDRVEAGQPIAELRDVWGRPLPNPVLTAPCLGFVLARSAGIYFYAGQTVLQLAIVDDAPYVAPYP